MSTYESYDEVSRIYDSQRTPGDADVEAALLQFYCNKPLKEIHLLDAGCGTGNYSKALLDYGVGRVSLLDASPGMLGKARAKLDGALKDGRVDSFVESKLPCLPYEDGTFDAVMFNFVLHHITSNPDGENFPEMESTFTEVMRVLRPGGVLLITTGFPALYTDVVWYSQLNANITKRFNKLFPTLAQLDKMLRDTGFKCSTRMNLSCLNSLHEIYVDPEGPLKPEWRRSDSYWSVATQEEISTVEEKVAMLRDSGKLEEFVKEHDKTYELGMMTLVIATRV